MRREIQPSTTERVVSLPACARPGVQVEAPVNS
jgi:hypothetical protein